MRGHTVSYQSGIGRSGPRRFVGGVRRIGSPAPGLPHLARP
ncbi:hypothetical protein T261_4332 [Streptomyces lydicus]|nr:hypothetical protein T261_4332 [Streptomyces lydicus]